MPQVTHRALEVIGLKRMDYRDAAELQESLVARCLDSEGRENFLVLLEHPPVITIGRSGNAQEILARREVIERQGVDVCDTNRGGRVTFHGPGQLVAYPVMDLQPLGRDLHRYLRGLEAWLIGLLDGYRIAAGANPPFTGVWVNGAKIASIGIAVRHWIAYHGVALNVSNDLSFFDLIVPCGLTQVKMTSMRELMGSAPTLEEVACRAAETFCDSFGFPYDRAAGHGEELTTKSRRTRRQISTRTPGKE
jgi:lipoate-protein ligase B